MHGRVYSDSHGDEASEDEDEDTQWVPGPSFRNNQKLKLNFEIAYQDVKDYWDDHVDGDDIFVPQEAWAFVSDPRFAYDTTAFTDLHML